MRRILALVLTLALAAAGCGGDSDDAVTIEPPSDGGAEAPADDGGAEPSPTTAEPEPEPEPEEFDISTVEQSVVKILAQGSFIDPEVGEQVNAAGIGTGFIISEDGLAVTNNHVVTGAALLQVFLPGQPDPVNARLLGVSECSDLAVIDIEGEGFTPLSFREGEVSTGLDVFAAGYPLTDARSIEEIDYTLTRGIISSTAASGETNWASVDSVYEHDARIRGGNSGGPLVDENGRVVAVNYAGADQTDQNYAIGADRAGPIIETLRSGSDVDSIGINGQAILDEEAGLTGIWVASVASGSPASNAGSEAGDILTRLEGLVLATDGTMADYCDILRTQGADATMAVEVLRFATEEVLEGEINGAPLEQSFCFACVFDEEVAPDDAGTPAADTYQEYVTVTDDSGQISVSVPAEWSDTDGRPNEEFGPSIFASPDLESFLGTWETPGIILEATNEIGAGSIPTVLEQIDLSDSCTDEGTEPYEDPLYTGSIQLWTDCGEVGTVSIVAVVSSEPGDLLIRLLIQAVEVRDLDAADQALNTFVATLG